MPGLDQTMQNNSVNGMTYSATRLNELGATEYTLVTIVSDASGSVASFKSEMEATLKEAVNSCKLSPRAENLMLRHTTFNSDLKENHGFKLLTSVNTDDYNDCLDTYGATALFNATLESIETTSDYAKQLVQGNYNVNAVVFIITDGDNNAGTALKKDVAKSLAKIRKDEKLESIVTILIGVNLNDPTIEALLKEFKDEANLDQFVLLKDASKKSLAKLASFVSKSISAQSISLGTGGPSQALTNGSLTI